MLLAGDTCDIGHVTYTDGHPGPRNRRRPHHEVVLSY